MFTNIIYKEVVPMYSVWIFTMFPMEDPMIVGLTKKKYKVSALAKDGNFISSNKNNPAVCIALSLEGNPSDTTNNETEYKKVYSDVKAVLDNNNILYYGLIVAQTAGSTWSIGNIVLPENSLPSKTINE